MSLRKPHKACDAEVQHLRFPLIGMPKIDGVRGLVQDAKLYSRTLKLHPNLYSQARFGKEEYNGLDGELALDDPTGERQCNRSSSAIGRIKEEPDFTLWAFDLLTPETEGLGYTARLCLLKELVDELGVDHIQIVPHVLITSQEELEAWEQTWLEEGYEGIILRDPEGKHKQGRSTARENGFLRIKRFTDSEGIVLEIKEGQSNGNEAQINELGRTKRSTHKENMKPNGLVGTIVMKDVYSGQVINVSPGNMTEDERKFYFENQDQIVGKIGKYKAFMYGVKVQPRFAGWLGFRNPEEM
ncbi:DNA ligase [Stenotrophomonas phage vB_SmaS_DLP_3]|nr:DNA ligase [Stenotrophomonas phage vB_SmaS_DLP_3]